MQKRMHEFDWGKRFLELGLHALLYTAYSQISPVGMLVKYHKHSTKSSIK